MPCCIVRKEDGQQLETSKLFGPNEFASISTPIGPPISENLTAGFLRLKPGYKKRFISPVDEIDYFLEGSLTYTSEGVTYTARPGDVVSIAKGDEIEFTTEEGCFVFFVTYPLMQETLEAVQESKNKT